MIQTSSMLGLLHRTVPTPCATCAGTGHLIQLPVCHVCDARGLVGNESEICRSCNGTGHIDAFALIPLELIKPGVNFQRRCDKCGNEQFQIRTPVEQQKLYKTWDAAEELRQYELVERVRVSCSRCPNAYEITIDPLFHQAINVDDQQEIERLGIDLSFLYQGQSASPAAPPAR
jgi:hypothetical protein